MVDKTVLCSLDVPDVETLGRWACWVWVLGGEAPSLCPAELLQRPKKQEWPLEGTRAKVHGGCGDTQCPVVEQVIWRVSERLSLRRVWQHPGRAFGGVQASEKEED